MTKLSFNEFDAVSSKQWKQKIQFDLKGADYNKTLLTHTNEGITINPFYHLDQTKYLDVKLPDKHFKICETIFVDDAVIANKLAKKALLNGATALRFVALKPFDINLLLNKVNAKNNNNSSLHLYFELDFFSQNFITKLFKETSQYKIFLNCDIIGHLAKTGNWFFNKKTDFKILAAIFKSATNKINVLGVNAGLYQNAGANLVQQVAYALAHVNEYLNAFLHGVIEPNLTNKIQVNFAVGGQFFPEIAKLRAFRYLFNLIAKEYHFDLNLEIFVEPSLRNKSIYDYNVNMLRTTTECMSAIIGGANMMSNVSYDAIFHKSNAFGQRIARNQLLILQEESYFKNVQQAVKGTYYIEALSIQIADKALKIFKEIEQKGGFIKQLMAGVVQRKINENAKKELAQFDTGELSFIGVNKYPNLQDKMGEDLELYPFLKTKPHKTLIQPIVPKRLSEKLEKERLAKENV